MKLKYLYIIFTGMFLVTSCNEKEFLEEKPLDFYSPENSYTKQTDFSAGLSRLYFDMFSVYIDINAAGPRALYYPTDIAYDAIDVNHELNQYKDQMSPITGVVGSTWKGLYQIIYDANVVIGRIEDPSIVFSPETKRQEYKAEARFFRAFAYRTLGILYGGVPLVLDETKAPKRDFVRASKEEVFQQCIDDLEFAATNLPEITAVEGEGKVSKAVADHLLAEVYIITKQWDKAVTVATRVIDNPNFKLMTQRFGRLKTQPGDVYWDMFRRDNQNRSAGNTEGLWVYQFEYLTPGGGKSQAWPRYLIPNYWGLKDPNNVNLFIGPTSQNGGRGIGWYGPTDYVLDEIWKDDNGNFVNDMRNSQYNIIRDIKADNPASAYNGKFIVASGAIADFPNTLTRFWRPLFIKITPINDFPAEFITNPQTGLLNSSASYNYTDNYIFRLAETYLLRAEAYVGKGEPGNAALDINKVRNRANASDVDPADVDIDYILDERARELSWEEPRLLTLMRMGKLIERVNKYNPITGNGGILEYQNLWPIPAREIETNTEAELTQNPGYFK